MCYGEGEAGGDGGGVSGGGNVGGGMCFAPSIPSMSSLGIGADLNSMPSGWGWDDDLRAMGGLSVAVGGTTMGISAAMTTVVPIVSAPVAAPLMTAGSLLMLGGAFSYGIGFAGGYLDDFYHSMP